MQALEKKFEMEVEFVKFKFYTFDSKQLRFHVF